MSSWLAEFLSSFTMLWPFWRVLVRATHGGVRFRAGRVRALKPGCNWYWPLFTEVEVVDTAPGPMELQSQSLLTEAETPIVVSPMVRYRITDVVRAVGRRLDIATIIEDHVSAAVAYEFSDCSVKEVMAG